MATNGNAAANAEPEATTGNPSHRYLSTRGEDAGVRFPLGRSSRLYSTSAHYPPLALHADKKKTLIMNGD
ncbi:hypothetical protein NLG97_g6163 [Lecanicillium saksenae]|uniref:Uncharacterized protein n=1 Tax=Lecanicillium saksenae TaxID=468837 RepID=A0ACC1QTL0_9HYPO|nr:hypothetical protein NLG97_g6163 [Lecanicillium saksenae]